MSPCECQRIHICSPYTLFKILSHLVAQSKSPILIWFWIWMMMMMMMMMAVLVEIIHAQWCEDMRWSMVIIRPWWAIYNFSIVVALTTFQSMVSPGKNCKEHFPISLDVASVPMLRAGMREREREREREEREKERERERESVASRLPHAERGILARNC